MAKVTVIVVNYKTQALTQKCIVSFVNLFFDTVPLILVDNRSQDDSSEYCRRVAGKVSSITYLPMEKNMGHGPAMHRAIKTIETKYFFTLDSDCEVLKRGFFQPMLAMFDNPKVYAVGWLRWVNTDGVPAEPTNLTDNAKSKFVPYIHPHAALFDREKYHTLPLFDLHGAPCYNNMRVAKDKGYALVNFAIQDYIKHMGAGTRRMWGGAWDVRDRPVTREWNVNDNYPL